VEYFQNIFETTDKNLLFDIFSRVNLQIIDKLRVAHIDEMQYLKDKVGFMGYAQLDPLIVYKKESFEKFQELLASITADTTSMLMRINFSALAQQQQAHLQIIEAVEKNPDLLAKLKSASQIYSADGIVSLGSSPSTKSPLPPFQKGGSDAREMLFSDEDGVEVFEVDGDKADSPSSDVIL
jgi:preprotein translocase subunit SecA